MHSVRDEPDSERRASSCGTKLTAPASIGHATPEVVVLEPIQPWVRGEASELSQPSRYGSAPAHGSRFPDAGAPDPIRGS